MSMTEIEKMQAEALGIEIKDENKNSETENNSEKPDVDTGRITEDVISGGAGFMLGYTVKALIDRDPQKQLEKKQAKQAKKAERKAKREEKKAKLKEELDALKEKQKSRKFYIGWVPTQTVQTQTDNSNVPAPAGNPEENKG